MKIKTTIKLVVEVDSEQWEAAYGVSGSEAIKKDVQSYIAHGSQGAEDAPIRVLEWSGK